jgi:ABC-2 type transport system permease protein
MSLEGQAAHPQQPVPSRQAMQAQSLKPKKRGALLTHLENVSYLVVKELRSFRSDPILLLLVAYAFTIAIYAAATGVTTEATNLAVAVVDEDRSDLSRRIADGLTPPTFQRAVEIPATEIDSSMESQRFVFVIEIPPRFEKDILAGRQPSVQINVDATAVSQAFNGMTYIENVIVNYVSEFVTGREGLMGVPIKAVTRVMFNPNQYSLWFTAVMQVLSNLTMLAVILTGAALIREREQGTVEHLLVMPVVPVEIMLSKILANAVIILAAAALSMTLVVEGWLDVPIAGSRLLFFAGSCIFVLTVGSLGIALGTIASTMGQFGLLQIPVLLVLMLLSGATTPIESMPVWLQYIMKTISPMPHFVEFSKNVLFRGADLPIVWPQMAAVAALGAVYFGFTLIRFRRVIFESG